MDRSQSARTRVLLLPTIPWGPSWRAFRPGDGPDPVEITNILRQEEGIDTDLVDPSPWPWNPFAGRHPVLQGIDPVRSIRALISAHRYDVIVTSFEAPALLPGLLRHVARLRTPIAVCDIGVTEDWPFRERLLDVIIPRLDAILVIGSNQTDYIARRWRTNAWIEPVYYHVDTNFYVPQDGAADGPILSLGEDGARDFNCLLEAVSGRDVPLVVKTKRQLEIPPASRVSIVSERLSHRDLRTLYAQSRFVVVPLRSAIHASGVTTIVEAMAMGKALIVSDSPGIRDYIRHEETCLVVPCGDARALRQAIDRLIAEPDTRARLGAGARRFVETQMSHRAYARRFGAALRRVASLRRAKSTVGQPVG